MKCERDLFKKNKLKTMNIKMETNSQLSTTESKKTNQANEQNRNRIIHGDHLEGYQLGGGRGRTGDKVQGLRSINGRYKIDRGMLKIV